MQKDVARKQEETKGDKIVDDKERKKEPDRKSQGTNQPFSLASFVFRHRQKNRKKTSSQGKSKKFALTELCFHAKANFLPLFDYDFAVIRKRRSLFPI